MRAAFYERSGPAAEVLRVGELPDPSPGPGEVRVRVAWSGVNPSDTKLRAGLRGGELPFPRIVPHSDGMGVIDAVGDDVPRSRIGERVWLWNAGWGRAMGTAAELVVLPQAQAVPMPAGVSDEVGACLGIPALTALHAVLTGGGVAGQSVLVAGGAGAVGHYAVQFAQLLGARRVLTTVSSPPKAALARAAGADVVIDYRHDNVAALVREATYGRGVDRIIDVDVAGNSGLALEVIRPGGDWVVYGSGKPQFELPFFPLIAKNVVMRFFIVYSLNEHEREHAHATLAELLARGALVHNIAERLPLERIAEAHEQVEQGRAMGKVLVSIGAGTAAQKAGTNP